ncbi:ergothioneine biosynthesis protein EgtB [Ottowia thiooxydans]|uniref:Ergothioneine biosynthesis protein EgtB n=1 Tax=Ottowia thiooxydans TaxID=219182 RepID=A0ABV2QDS3_9BURK
MNDLSRLPNSDLLEQFNAVRAHTRALVAPLSAEDCAAQSMPDASPAKWHLGHTTWFFETFVLAAHEPGFAPFRPEFRVLFNSYYHAIGERHPRPQRGLLTRPSLEEVMQYRADVDHRMQALMAHADEATPWMPLVTLGLQHEQQHQELLLTDIKHLLSCNPMWPAYTDQVTPAQAATAPVPAWQAFKGGLIEIGHQGTGFAFDNESPCHKVYLAPFELSSRLVSNAEYARFIEEGGYEDSSLWLAEGWDWRASQDLSHPIYWQPRPDGGWDEFTLSGRQALDLAKPALHLSYYESDAYARWAGARLPTEAEWEHAMSSGVPSTKWESDQWIGHAWQWTQSSYAPYPGFRIAEGAVGEYNGKFMVNQYVLRGSSVATPAGHARLSYRNFFPATARWQFSGIRLARHT